MCGLRLSYPAQGTFNRNINKTQTKKNILKVFFPLFLLHSFVHSFIEFFFLTNSIQFNWIHIVFFFVCVYHQYFHFKTRKNLVPPKRKEERCEKVEKRRKNCKIEKKNSWRKIKQALKVFILLFPYVFLFLFPSFSFQVQ